MANLELTPTKTLFRLNISPKSKESVCILCLESISNPDYRRKLFSKCNKTQACANLEVIVGAKILKETCVTGTLCRKCDRKNEILVKKIIELRLQYSTSEAKLVADRGVIESVKRQSKEGETTDQSGKRRARSLFEAPCTDQPTPLAFISTTTEKSTQTLSWPEDSYISAVYVVIQYPNSPSRIVQLKSELERIGRQLALGDSTSISRALVAIPDVNETVHQQIFQEITSEIVGLCSKINPSVLRKSSPEDLTQFSWEIVHEELKNRAPRYVQFLESAITNPSQGRNVLKTKETLAVPMLDAGCQLISIFNEDMNVTRKIKSVILKKGSLKKAAFKRLSPLYVCMGYGATNSLFESAGKGFDKSLKEWKIQVEGGEEKENSIRLSLENAVRDGGTECALAEQLDQELKSHRLTMHPGYSFTGDNVDMRILPRQMTINNKNKDHHMYQMVAFKNRVSSNDLPNEHANGDLKQVPFSTFLPSASDQSILVDELIVLIGHVWGQYIPSLAWFMDYLPNRIVHVQMENTQKKTEKVHLGVLRKNEQYEEDMLDILQWLHQYVPRHDEDSDAKPVKVLSGGDYLTFERHKEAQSGMQDARTPSARLEGLIPKIEDFHNQAEWLKVIWHHLYDTGSCRDKGTLYAARNLLDARNVSNDPHNNFYACSEFLDKVLSAYLICGAMHHFRMEKLEDDAMQNGYTGEPNDKDAKKAHVNQVIRSFIEEHVVNHIPQLSHQAPVSNDLRCRFCNKSYVRSSALQKHEEKEHGLEEAAGHSDSPTSVTESDQDRVYNYTHQTLVLLLLRMNHDDAIKLGDGERVLRLYKIFCLYYKVSKCPKYAFAMLHLQAQVNCLLSPRLAHSLTWNRFVNYQGKVDTNFPMDMDVEHDNRAFKSDIHSFKGEITDKSITRVSHSTEPTDAILSAFDNSTHVRKPSGKHTKMSTEDDIMALVDQLEEGDLYRRVHGRKHLAFPNMKHDLLANLDIDNLKSWISKSLKKFSKKHCYHL